MTNDINNYRNASLLNTLQEKAKVELEAIKAANNGAISQDLVNQRVAEISAKPIGSTIIGGGSVIDKIVDKAKTTIEEQKTNNILLRLIGNICGSIFTFFLLKEIPRRIRLIGSSTSVGYG